MEDGEKETDCQPEEPVATKADLNSTMFSKGADTWATPLRPSPAANPKLLDAYFLPLQPAALPRTVNATDF